MPVIEELAALRDEITATLAGLERWRPVLEAWSAGAPSRSALGAPGEALTPEAPITRPGAASPVPAQRAGNGAASGAGPPADPGRATGRCAECGDLFVPRNSMQRCCSGGCRRKHHDGQRGRRAQQEEPAEPDAADLERLPSRPERPFNTTAQPGDPGHEAVLDSVFADAPWNVE
jgi:hypothetical protein